MVKRTKEMRKASAIGAVMAIVALVLAFGIVSAVDARGGSVIDANGNIIVAAPVLWSLSDASDIVNVELGKGGGCEPVGADPVAGDFQNGTATVGLGFNATTEPLQNCGGAGGLNFMYITTDLTAADVLALDPAAFGFSWESIDINATSKIPGGWYLIAPPGTGNALTEAIVCGSCDSQFVGNNETKFLPVEADAITLMEILPTWHVGFGFEAQEGVHAFPDFGDQLVIDASWYGANVTGLQGTGFSPFDIVPPAKVLNFSMWAVAFLAFFATIWIWPNTNLKSAPGFGKKKGVRK